jgi:hypothetical protein
MSHSDEAILMQMRETADYKLGYAMAAIRTAVELLEGNHVFEALEHLRETRKLIRTTAEVV